MNELTEILSILRRLHDQIRDHVLAACEAQTVAELSAVSGVGPEDTIFAIDRVGEEALVGFLERELAGRWPLVLVAEGLPEGQVALPRGASPDEAAWRLITDPIDGTRCLMYQKRSGWILSGLAPNRGEPTSLADIVLAVQTEIPLVKQHLCDQLWAIRGQGAAGERINRLTGRRRPLSLRASTARTLDQGYASISRFFPGARDVLAAIEEELVRRVAGPQPARNAAIFEDQYPSTGGQIYCLCTGQDRFLADLRPLMEPILRQRGEGVGLCVHPYDICTWRIAEELGVRITRPDGGPLEHPLRVVGDVAWVGYANPAIRELLEPALQAILRERGLL